MPFVKLFKNVSLGVQTANALMLIAVVYLTALALSLTIISYQTYDIKILKHAKTELKNIGGLCSLTIHMKKICNKTGYYIETNSGELIDLYGKQTVDIDFADDTFDAFIIHMPNGKSKRVSSKLIK